jgi:hypothetical protein
MPDPDSEGSRTSLRLSHQAKEAVDEIKRLAGIKTDQEAIRRAIADERFLQRKIKDGWTVLLRRGDDYQEVVWAA